MYLEVLLQSHCKLHTYTITDRNHLQQTVFQKEECLRSEIQKRWTPVLPKLMVNLFGATHFYWPFKTTNLNNLRHYLGIISNVGCNLVLNTATSSWACFFSSEHQEKYKNINHQQSVACVASISTLRRDLCVKKQLFGSTKLRTRVKTLARPKSGKLWAWTTLCIQHAEKKNHGNACYTGLKSGQ